VAQRRDDVTVRARTIGGPTRLWVGIECADRVATIDQSATGPSAMSDNLHVVLLIAILFGAWVLLATPRPPRSGWVGPGDTLQKHHSDKGLGTRRATDH
ncbi:MAG: hypothetical protein ACREQ5_33785, partial [Candidatus Dormibacteria bacterium]